MFQSFRPAARRVALSAALVVLAGGGTAAGVAAASASAKPAPPLSHQLCYRASGTGFKVPTGVTLKNALNPAWLHARDRQGRAALQPRRQDAADGEDLPHHQPGRPPCVPGDSPPRRSPSTAWPSPTS